MSKAASTLRRALLYVPSSSPKFLQKSTSLNVDTVAYDLEDSVTIHKKDEARANLAEFLKGPKGPGIREQAVRINSVESGLALKDLEAVISSPHLQTIVLPKTNTASDLLLISDYISHHAPTRPASSPPLKIIALIESALSVISLPQITRTTPLLAGLIFAAEDFALDLSLRRTPGLQEMLYARSAIATAARAADLESTIDLVCTSFRGEEGRKTLEEECEGGKGLGFNGKQCIHPDQVGVVQRIFAPSEQEVVWAVRCVIADEKASTRGRGAWTLDGKMIDAPVSGKARGVVKRAEFCGFDIAKLKEEWKGQEPE